MLIRGWQNWGRGKLREPNLNEEQSCKLQKLTVTVGIKLPPRSFSGRSARGQQRSRVIGPASWVLSLFSLHPEIG